MGQIEKLSNSALDRFSSCPLSFYHAYVNDDRPEKRDTTEYYAEFGIIIHFLVEMYPRTNFYRNFDWRPERRVVGDDIDSATKSFGNQLMERGTPLTLDEMIAIYDNLFPLIKFPDAATSNEYYMQGLEYINKIPEMDWSKVIGLEQYFRIDIGNGSPPITGLIDKVERDEKGIIVVDYKTSKPYSEAATMKKSQLPIYGMAVYLMYGEFPYKYKYDFVRFGKEVEVEIPIERLAQVKDNIKFKYAQMLSYQRQGSFPAQYNDFYCKHFCGYSRLCSRFGEFNGQ